MTDLKIIDWNICGLAAEGQARKAEALRELNWDLCLLQDATRDSVEDFAQAVGAADAVSVQRHLSDDVLGTRGLTYFCAMLVRSTLRVIRTSTLAVPSPERALTVVLDMEGRRFTAASAALPPGSNWGPAKGRQALLIARWLAERSGPVVLGIDANTPKVEHPDLAQNVWWEEGEKELLGVDRLHDARDVYRDYLESRGGLAGRPTDEPLATSFERHGGAGVRVACRYDAIYATPEWDVREASYHYKEGRDAGSDHGYVRATLAMPEGGPPR